MLEVCYLKWVMFVNGIRKLVNFEGSKRIICFLSSPQCGTNFSKFSVPLRNKTLELQILHSDALLCYRDSMVKKAILILFANIRLLILLILVVCRMHVMNFIMVLFTLEVSISLSHACDKMKNIFLYSCAVSQI